MCVSEGGERNSYIFVLCAVNIIQENHISSLNVLHKITRALKTYACFLCQQCSFEVKQSEKENEEKQVD